MNTSKRKVLKPLKTARTTVEDQSDANSGSPFRVDRGARLSPEIGLDIPTSGSTSSTSTYHTGETVMCSYNGIPYPAKILEISTKREIEEINAQRERAKLHPPKRSVGGAVGETQGQSDQVAAGSNSGGGEGAVAPEMNAPETEPQDDMEDDDMILYYVHYIRWKPKWDEWVAIERLSPIQIGKEDDGNFKKSKGKRMTSLTRRKKDSASVNGSTSNESGLKKAKLERNGSASPSPSYGARPAKAVTVQGETYGTGHLILKLENVEIGTGTSANGFGSNGRIEGEDDDQTLIFSNSDFATLGGQRSLPLPSPVPESLEISHKVSSADELSTNLKNVLLADLFKIKNEDMVVSVQSNTGISAEDLLTEYSVYIQNTGNDHDLSKAELFVDGLRTLIRAHLTGQLLYDEEIPSMMLALNDAGLGGFIARVSAIYVLRLLTRIDVLLEDLYNLQDVENSTDWKAVQIEKRKFIEFLDSRSSFYFPISMYIPNTNQAIEEAVADA